MDQIIKLRNMRARRESDELAKGRIGLSLIARVGLLVAHEVAMADPERFFQLVRRLATEDPSDHSNG